MTDSWHPQVFPTARQERLREAGLPLPPTNFSPYDEWIAAARAHLHNALDTAVDDLQRDRDFILDDDPHPISPDGMTRQECITEAVRLFLADLNAAQESP